jgi:formylglycine-generating enzyme required for sulfatase activity
MHGNVYEWCTDPWHKSHNGRPLDESTWLADGDFGRRVVRGGSWGNAARVLRSARRTPYSADSRVNNVGFRVVRTLIC